MWDIEQLKNKFWEINKIEEIKRLNTKLTNSDAIKYNNYMGLLEKNGNELGTVHLSDVHFGNYIYRPTYITKCHDIKILKGLSEFIKKHKFDMIFLTGDVVTGGDDNAFQHARNFIYGRITTPDYEVGLDLNEDDENIFIVPGNHDYYPNCSIPFTRRTHKFNNYFPKNTTPYVKFVYNENVKTTVFGMDSLSGINHSIANGKVNKKDLNWLKRTCKSLDEGTFSDSPYNETDYRNSYKMVLMHHHIFLPKRQHYSKLTKIKNRKQVIATFLECDIDFVFFGHEHHYFVEYPQYSCLLDKRVCGKLKEKGYNPKKRLCICMASTASQADAEDNSIWVLKLSEDNLLQQRYYFSESGFVPSAETTTLKLTRITK